MTPLDPGEVLLGKLRVVRTLGAGAMGVVYEVEHQLTHHRRAMKVLAPEVTRDEEQSQRFLREVSAAGRIGSPHIVETFDAGTLEDGRPFLLMEKLEGQPLDGLLRGGAMSPGAAAFLGAQISRALAAAHARGIVHRDIKPANLFVSTRDGLPFVKVLDFGLSRFDPQITGALAMTASGVTMGTPLYMAPEQMRGSKVDDRADVYAVGVVLYECLTGRPPIEADSFAELAAKVMRSDFQPLPTSLPRPLVELVHAAMSATPGDRPSSDELAQRLSPLADTEQARRLLEPGALDDTLRPTAVPAASLAGTAPRAAPGRRTLLLGASVFTASAALAAAVVSWGARSVTPATAPPPAAAQERPAPPPAPPPATTPTLDLAPPAPSPSVEVTDAGTEAAPAPRPSLTRPPPSTVRGKPMVRPAPPPASPRPVEPAPAPATPPGNAPKADPLDTM